MKSNKKFINYFYMYKDSNMLYTLCQMLIYILSLFSSVVVLILAFIFVTFLFCFFFFYT